jgi:hypothetical protein
MHALVDELQGEQPEAEGLEAEGIGVPSIFSALLEFIYTLKTNPS